MKAPEKLYLIRKVSRSTSLNTTNDSHDEFLQEWYKGREKDTDIEYIRKDVFIEKACEWLNKHAKKYYFNKNGHYLGTDELVEDFKLSMEL